MPTPYFLNRTSAILLGSALMLLSASAAAAPRATENLPEPYRIPTAYPSNIGEIRDVTGDALQGWEGEIHQDLSERAVCGGWDMSDTVQGKIPVVSGVPGRKGIPLGNIPSGMAARDESSGALGDGYLYPDVSEVKGWSTACQAGFPPYLDDGPPCKDPNNKNYGTPKQCEDLCPRINAWQFPIWVVIWVRPAPLADMSICVQQGKGGKELNYDSFNGDCCERNGTDEETVSPAYTQCMTEVGDEAYCRGLYPPQPGVSCAGKYGSDADDPRHDPGLPADAKCNESPGLGYIQTAVIFSGWYYCCTGAIVRELNYDDCKLEDPAACVAHSDPRRNCVRCEGDGLPVPNGASPARDTNGDLIPRGPAPLRQETGCRAGYDATIDGNVMNPGRFVSYYREYPVAGYSRDAVDQAPKDVTARQGVPVSCYGFYREFDPKTTRTADADSRCVIAAYQSNNEFRLFYKTQLGHGSFGETSVYPDPDPTADTEIRDPGFNADEDLWYQNLGGAFSLLNGKKFKEAGQDITFALLSLDSTLERVRGPMLAPSGASAGSVSSGRGPDPYESMRSPGALRRAFDDSVSNQRGPARTIAEWWQKQETAMQDVVHPAVAHIIFPSAWSANLNLQHHFPSPVLPEPPTTPVPPGNYDPRRDTIEVQTELRDDLLGEVASFLEEALIAPVEERSVTIVVPFGSATDFRAYKEGWVRWQKMREDAGKPVPPETQPFIDRLEEYAVQIDGARALRGQLARSLAASLERQADAAQAVHDWLETNLDDFRDFQQERQQRQQLIYRWRDLQTAYRNFHDKTNMPWCKNDAFTTPIYSLLDSWMLGRPDLNGQSLPQISYPRPEDVYIDLSVFQTDQVPLVVPVLKPVQILVSHDMLSPPFVFQEEVSIPVLPPLPPLPDAASSMVAAIPDLEVGPALSITFPDVSLVLNAYSQCMEDVGDESYCRALYGDSDPLISMEKLVGGMNAKYKQFWDAVTKPRCDTAEAAKRCAGADPAEGDCCVQPGEEKYCRRGWNSDTCVHVEMDLLERFTRIGARPAVQLLEDFLVIGSWRTPGNANADFPPCDPQDWACLNLHAVRMEPRYGWGAEMSTSSADAAIDALRARMFQETLQSPQFPYQAPSETIVPSFDVRPPLDLSPLSPSPSIISP
ncbi:hypothetical protein A2881_03270 [Candidatus Peribacteria bacterium RIFCSPHIGHO2_01_FULL_55_13]|nr:MAG: hypothetical protein A2881_03270 [Candidatus Peribacteria bacterium RIFCSPHIGHO2_01_FULL_55_13]